MDMRTVIVGAGPSGLYIAIALARRGHQVTVIDRDSGPNGMLALPSSLDAVEPRAREIYASGWRPPTPDGPSRDELADLVTRTANTATVRPSQPTGHGRELATAQA
jgi:flavin-dependent dehydrogenase